MVAIKVEVSACSGGGEEGEPLRIAYLLQQFPLPTETFAVSDVAALVEQGHSVTVFTMKRRRTDEGALLDAGGLRGRIEIRSPAFSGALRWPALGWRWRGAGAHLAKRILKGAPASPKAALQALLCLPRLIEIADAVVVGEADVAHAFWSRHVGLVLPLLEKQGAATLRTAFVGAYDLVADDPLVGLTLGSAEAAFSHAEANRAYLERNAKSARAREIIVRGIPLSPLSDEAGREPCRCITASALTPSKNVGAVIRAFAAALPAEPRSTLSIFGDGPDRPRLEALARELRCSDRVRFGGHVPRRELFDEMQRSRVFLSLSQKPSERLPNVLKEAMWAGCAVVASESEGIGELIPDRSIGHVVDSTSPEAASAALVEILRERPEVASARRSKAREWIARHFSSGQSMGRYVACWRQAITQRPIGSSPGTVPPDGSRPWSRPAVARGQRPR